MTPRLHAVMAVFEEATLIRRAISSLAVARPDELHVFDGAWRGGKNGAHTFAGAPGSGASRDDTSFVAHDAAADLFGGQAPAGFFHLVTEPWPSQEAKRTALFQEIGAREGDWILVLDADEELSNQHSGLHAVESGGAPADPREWLTAVNPTAANIMVKCVGENDMPDVRGEWPAGDYSPYFKPELRLFRWTPDLECVYPGGYWQNGRLIQPYRTAQGRIESALPIAPLWLLHHGNDRTEDRKAAKLDYYRAEHPERLRWQRAFHA